MIESITKRPWTIAFTLIFLIFTISIQGQKRPIAPQIPFDFIDEYYIENGINPEAIVGRRNGYDGLSVFDRSPDPLRNDIRVIATIPGYDVNGQIVFWYPLGELYTNAFTDDKVGRLARKTASLFPLYVFPESRPIEYAFANTRQAALVDESVMAITRTNIYPLGINPLGLREIVQVYYTEKALNTKEGWEMMQALLKKNGYATDNTPIIKTREDLQILLDHEMITLNRSDLVQSPNFAIAPVIYDPRHGAIAFDAFLWMATVGGQPLPSEEIFKWQFNCLQKTGEWCE